jgi:predicted acetyltransferase
VAATSTIEIRTPAPDELALFVEVAEAAFLERAPDDDVERLVALLDPERQYLAFDRDVPVGAAGTLDFRMSIPGGVVPIAAVTAVGVHASHRRRGIMSGLMRRQLDDAHERGEPVAALWATEAAIYGRFGYGVATTSTRVKAERDRMVFRRPDEPGGSTRIVAEEEEAVEVASIVYDRVQATTPGMIARSQDWWTLFRAADSESWRRGGGPLYRVVWEDEDGEPQAYAFYRSRPSWERGVPAGTLDVREAVGATPEATRELWRYLFGIDLHATVQAYHLPPDHPLFLSVTEPRRLHARFGDGLWVRLLDLPQALVARSYAKDGSVAFDIRDTFCPWNEGTWTLSVEGGGAGVEQGGNPELRLDVADLGSTYLGGFTFAALAAAGRVEELAPGALDRADALFRTRRQPWCAEVF